MHSLTSWRATNRKLRAVSLVGLALTLGAGATAWAQDANSEYARVALPYNQEAAAMLLKNARFIGHQSPETQVNMVFMLPLRNQSALATAIHQLYDPTDRQHYHHFITPKDFTAQYGPTEEDYNTVISYAESEGFKIVGKTPSRTLLRVQATTDAVETAFGLRIDRYLMPNGHVSYAPEGIPSVPNWLASRVTGIAGLDSLSLRHHHHTVLNGLSRELNALNPHVGGHGPVGGYTPTDVTTAYNVPSSLTGQGQSVALFELDAYNPTDIAAYTTKFGITTPNIQNVYVDGYDGSIQDATFGGETEVTLDIDMVLAIAPKISTVYYYGALNDDADALVEYQQIANDDLAKVVCTSWGEPEDVASKAGDSTTENGIFQQMAMQGQSVFVASGDDGAYEDTTQPTVPVIDDPGGQPYVTGVGGTQMTITDASIYSSEVAWSGSGGGISGIWPKPSYQTGIQGSTGTTTTFREEPDVSLNADPDTGYDIFVNDLGGWLTVGGTSSAAPLWAGFTALVNQQSAIDGDTFVGFINPAIYAIGQNATAYPLAFHDILTGDNGDTAYAAKAGYDDSTGWGSFNATGLLQQVAFPAGSVAGAVTGTVTDTNGVPISGATVQATNSATDELTNSTTTSATGTYQLALQSGSPSAPFVYSLTFSAAGYAGTVIPGVEIPVTGDTVTENAELPIGHMFPAGLQMISAPYEFGNIADFSTLFGLADDPPIGPPAGTDPSLYIWQPSQSAYVQTPSSPADTLHNGDGYWIDLSQATPLARQGTPAPTGQNFIIVLQQGWNMIGDPLTEPVPLSSVDVTTLTQFATSGTTAPFGNSANNVYQTLFTYPAGGGTGVNGYNLITATGALEPWQGYWIYAYSNCELVIPPLPTPPAPVK